MVTARDSNYRLADIKVPEVVCQGNCACVQVKFQLCLFSDENYLLLITV